MKYSATMTTTTTTTKQMERRAMGLRIQDLARPNDILQHVFIKMLLHSIVSSLTAPYPLSREYYTTKQMEKIKMGLRIQDVAQPSNIR